MGGNRYVPWWTESYHISHESERPIDPSWKYALTLVWNFMKSFVPFTVFSVLFVGAGLDLRSLLTLVIGVVVFFTGLSFSISGIYDGEKWKYKPTQRVWVTCTNCSKRTQSVRLIMQNGFCDECDHDVWGSDRHKTGFRWHLKHIRNNPKAAEKLLDSM